MLSLLPLPQADLDAIEVRTQVIGKELFDRVGRGPWPWQAAWRDDRLMNLALGEPAVKTQLFRFTDVLPTLRSNKSVREHLLEYLDEAHDRVPAWMRFALNRVPAGPRGDALLAKTVRFGASQMARKFIAGATPAETSRTIAKLRRRNLAFTVDLLGEAVITEAEADAYQASCLDLLRSLSQSLAKAKERLLIDRDHLGLTPKVNLSLKLTSLTSRFLPSAVEATSQRVLARLRPILRLARELGAFVNIDMEQYAVKDLTYAIFRQVLSEPDFRDWPNVGIVVQAYLHEAERDLKMLRDFVAIRETPITIRLVKGAYWDYEVIKAQENDWPIPVFTEKWRSDWNYERLTLFLMQHHEHLRPALGSHNLRSLAKGMAVAESLKIPNQAWEVQVLHGMGEPIAKAVSAMGRRVRVYAPCGAILPGMAYLVRRLLENTSNESFLKASFRDHQAIGDLLRNPEETGAMWFSKRKSALSPSAHQANSKHVFTSFRNEPLADFSKEEPRAAMRQALEKVKNRLPIECPARIGGADIWGETFLSTDPGDFEHVIGKTSKGSPTLATEAVSASVASFGKWSRTSLNQRIAVLTRAAEIMRRRRFELAAWEVFECAKPWREADGDVAEAIDFCEFYAREMQRLAQPRERDTTGETNVMERIPRGVAVVIPPWNFPLAIPMGMTAAALVAGNSVVLKPSENSPVMAWHLCQIFKEAGLPDEVLQFLPGYGDVGAALVADPRVSLIAFTGSREVGLKINKAASETHPNQHHVKKVIAEMGGKNAIIIDDDADLDEAVSGVLQSAFGYSGQKCSACSRLIVLADVYETVLTRLAQAVKSLPVGSAIDPDTAINPVIDSKAVERISRYRLIAEQEGRIIAHIPIGDLAKQGNYVEPFIVADVRPQSPLAQDEIFGPVLTVLKAANFDEAIHIANGTAYALTAGLYSRRPARIEQAKHQLQVGNLYINRTITGALVDRQPFGGFKLSGMGSKAGGPDYLLEFLFARSITENTMRRGFSPELVEEPDVALATAVSHQ